MNDLQKLKESRKKYKKISRNFIGILIIFSLLSLLISIFIWIKFALVAAIIVIVSILIFSIVNTILGGLEQALKEYYFNLPENKKIKEEYENMIKEYERFLENQKKEKVSPPKSGFTQNLN